MHVRAACCVPASLFPLQVSCCVVDCFPDLFACFPHARSQDGVVKVWDTELKRHKDFAMGGGRRVRSVCRTAGSKVHADCVSVFVGGRVVGRVVGWVGGSVWWGGWVGGWRWVGGWLGGSVC
jgi:hypothetical protein